MELAKANKRIRQLEEELAISEEGLEAVQGGSNPPTMVHPMIDALVDNGHRVKQCCQLLEVNSPGYYKYKKRALSPTQMRRQWLTGLIREVHTASRQTYGSRRVHAELTL